MDNPDIFTKALVTSVMATISVRLGTLGELLWLFFAAVALDYVTGIAAAIYHRELSSGTGLRGIIKKVGECVVIAVAILSDEVAVQAGANLGFIISTGGAITSVVTIWLILNELISILENLARIGIDFPPFLMTLIKRLKNKTEDKTGRTDANTTPDDDIPADAPPAENTAENGMAEKIPALFAPPGAEVSARKTSEDDMPSNAPPHGQ